MIAVDQETYLKEKADNKNASIATNGDMFVNNKSIPIIKPIDR